MARRSLLKIFIWGLVVVVALVLLVLYRTPSIDSLVRGFAGRSYELNQIRDLLTGLRERDGIKGIVMVGNKERLNMRDGSQIPIPEALSRKSDPESIKRLETVMPHIDADYANLGDDDSLWVIMDGGGVLGNDFGYLYFRGDQKELANINDLKKIPGEDSWFAVVY